MGRPGLPHSTNTHQLILQEPAQVALDEPLAAHRVLPAGPARLSAPLCPPSADSQPAALARPCALTTLALPEPSLETAGSCQLLPVLGNHQACFHWSRFNPSCSAVLLLPFPFALSSISFEPLRSALGKRTASPSALKRLSLSSQLLSAPVSHGLTTCSDV